MVEASVGDENWLDCVVVCANSEGIVEAVNALSNGVVVELCSVFVKVVGVVDRSSEIYVLGVDVAEDDGIFSVVLVVEPIGLGCVVLTDGLKDEESISTTLLDAVGPSCVDNCELSAVKPSGLVVGVDHGMEAGLVKRDSVLAPVCEPVDVDSLFTIEESNFTLPLAFLAIATMAPTSAAVTNMAARQTAMKHGMVEGRHL